MTEGTQTAAPDGETTTRIPLPEPDAPPVMATETRIAIDPRFVAVVAALVAAAVLLRDPTLQRVVLAGVAATLVVLASIDLRERRLPNVIVLPAAAITLAANTILDPSVTWLIASLGTVVGLALPLLVNPRAVGLGDVKLGLLLGAALGAEVLGALMVGFLSVMPVALYLFARHGSAARKAVIPLGPFLAFGTIVLLLLGAPAS